MGTGKLDRSSTLLLCHLFLVVSSFSTLSSADKPSLAVGEFNKTLQLTPGIQVEKSPGLKPGTKVVCERVYIDGLSRFRNLKKFAHSVRVKVSQGNSTLRRPNVEVCFHRNASLGIGMCPQGKWEKVSNGLWAKPMSPFDHKLLDIRMTSSSTQTLEVSIEEEFFPFRIIFLITGIVLWSVAYTLSQSLVFYYSSAMAIGVILVVLIVLFQGMKLLPTGRKNSLAIVIYSSMLGLGSFLLRYIPRLMHSILSELGITEDMYNPLAIFLLGFLVLAGAWMGFWVVRKLVLTEDGSIDISTSYFVACSIRIVAAIMMLQSSTDPLLAAEAFLSGLMLSSILRKVTRLKFLRRVCKKLFKLAKVIGRNTQIPDLSTNQYSHDKYTDKRPEDSNFLRQRFNHFHLASCNTSLQGTTKTSPSQLSDMDSFPSTIHNTPERRKFSKGEWEKFTRESTKRAVKELVSSPDFNKWAAANAERITVTPRTSSGSASARPRRWFLW
ncbi:Inner Nuclear Membrane Protein B [Hibiscus trionum]|uniref:Inner Nuclear Membrane Protein B n=1 Tax=Hibiscus trionum TaxID=183268 RepID=A0A9W7JA70_HIBTR|nr:Inner Nuclear Membrane Protein B [Hibiscus trionum]